MRAPGTVTFDMPAGVLDGMDLRVAGQGNAGVAGGPPGDLYVGVDVEPSSAFERQGQDLYGVLDVTITQAALGGEVEIDDAGRIGAPPDRAGHRVGHGSAAEGQRACRTCSGVDAATSS